METSNALQVGTVVGDDYQVKRRLSSGSAGTVYAAYDVHLEREVAIKILQHHGSAERESLRQEAAALARLKHANVVSVYRFGDHDGLPYMAMEFVGGRSLREVLAEHRARRQQLPLHRALHLLCNVCDGLAATHGAGLVHRDIKPGNIVIEDRSGRVVLVDFGAAIARGSWDRRVVGTPAFLAPELMLGVPPSARSDLYALGCCAFELLTGRRPYRGASLDELRNLHATAPIPDAAAERRALEGVSDVLRALMAKRPEDRPASAAIVSNQLAEVLSVAAEADDAVETLPLSDGVAIGIHVLVVDDDPLFARVATRCVRLALAGGPVNVATASTGQGALEMVAHRRPDIVVLDYLLPDINGVETLSRIRAMPGGEHPEVLVASGTMAASEQWRFGILGVRDFIQKPVELTDLVRRLQEVARRHARRGPSAARPAAEETGSPRSWTPRCPELRGPSTGPVR